MTGTRPLLPLCLLLLALGVAPGRAQDAPAPADTSLGFEEFPDTGPAEEPLPAEDVKHIAPYVHYNRVDQWAVGMRMGFQPAAGWNPRFDVRVAHAFGRDHRGLYAMEIAQPVLSERHLLLGARVRRFTETEDESRVGSIENFLSAFFFHFDYRDYYEARGVGLFAEAHPWPSVSAEVAYSDLEIGSIPDVAPGSRSLFRRNEPWRPNPAVEEGRERAVTGDLVLDGRDNAMLPRRGEWLRLGVQATGPGLQSDFTYTRYEAEARGYLPLSPGMEAKARLWAGTTGAGALPTRNDFAIGGISTMRAHPFKSNRGDHVLLANAQYGVQVWRGRQRTGVKTNVWVLAFSDLGQAWKGESFDPSSQHFLWDGGLGLAVADARLQLFAAHDLHDSKSGIVWSVRLASPF